MVHLMALDGCFLQGLRLFEGFRIAKCNSHTDSKAS